MAIGKKVSNSEDDLGFGRQAVRQRTINKDGSINVSRRGLPLFRTTDIYNHLISMSWSRFWVIIVTGYLVTNLFFATVYNLTGIEHLRGAEGKNLVEHFYNAFFFSAQTLSTVGYGHISPSGFLTNTIAAFESMLGLLAFALATGLLYGRFSRPSAKIIFSENMLVAPYLQGERGFMFRLANMRANTLIDLDVSVVFSYNEEVDGKIARKFFPLALERSKANILTLSWTVVHPLTEDSPLRYTTHEDLERTNANFAVLLKAYDDAFSETVHSRTSYQYDEIIWGARFVPAFHTGEDGKVVLDLGKISHFAQADAVLD